MKRLSYSLLASAGILVLAFVLTAVGPKRVMAALGFTPIRDVDTPGRVPYQALTQSQSSGTPNVTADLPVVPAGNRLAIEHLSGGVRIPTGQTGYFILSTTAGGVSSFHTIPLVQRFDDGRVVGTEIVIASQPIRIYADPGTRPSITFRRSSNNGTVSVEGNVSGYYIGL